MFRRLKYFIIVLFFLGCAAPDYYQKDSAPITFIENVEAVQVMPVKDFFIVQDDLQTMGDDVQIQMDLSEPATLTDFLQLLGQTSKLQFIFDAPKPVTVMFDEKGQVPAASTSERVIVLGKYSGSLKGLLSMVQRTSGLFFYKMGDAYVVRDEAICILRILPQQHIEDMQGLLVKTFGVKDPVLDSRSGKIVFRANYRQYQDVAAYLRLYPVSVADIDILFTEAEINDENSIGFDVQSFAAALKEGGQLSAAFEITGTNGFTIKAQSGVASVTALISSLEKYQKHSVLQRVTVSALSNQPATVDVSEKIPYVSRVTSTAGQTGSAVRGYEFSTASSGVTIQITPIIDQDVLLLKNDLKYQHVADFLSVGSGADDQTQYPIVNARNVANIVSVRPGDVSKLATVRYKRKAQTSAGLYGLSRMLAGKEFRDYEINVFGRVVVKRYIFE